MIGFRTPPYDDTGLFHIFEHAVLAGSKRLPSKSNFFHISNSSVASLVNAFTSSDNTRYPFVTRSTQEYDNMMQSYLDAVFFPNAIKDPRIMQREGWRYEVHPQTKKMSINGIVLSEMKGVYSNPYSNLGYQIGHNLLPDTPYAFESGGFPEKISTLSFQQIVDAHKKYYHPQNSLIYLYGDLNFKEKLQKIDKLFLSEFTKNKNFKRPTISLQKNFDYPTALVEATYPGPKQANKDFVTKAFVLGPDLSSDDENAATVLMNAFVNNVPLLASASTFGVSTAVSPQTSFDICYVA